MDKIWIESQDHSSQNVLLHGPVPGAAPSHALITHTKFTNQQSSKEFWQIEKQSLKVLPRVLFLVEMKICLCLLSPVQQQERTSHQHSTDLPAPLCIWGQMCADVQLNCNKALDQLT